MSARLDGIEEILPGLEDNKKDIAIMICNSLEMPESVDYVGRGEISGRD